jgi:hypothetical protein
MELYGVEHIKVIVVSVAEIMNIASRVMNGSGLFALFGIMSPINKIRGSDMSLVLKELKDASATERTEIDKAFVGALELANKEVQAKIGTGAGYLEECITAVTDGLSVISRSQDLMARIKILLGL